MSAVSSSKNWLLAAFVILFSLFLSLSFASGAYLPTIRFDLPTIDANGHELGMFVRDEPLDLNFNLTFDYPFPAVNENDTLVIAEVWRGGQKLETGTVPLKKFLERYNIVSRGMYAFHPLYFNFSVYVEGRNVTYAPTTFTYNINQYRRMPYDDEGLNDYRNKWLVSGRLVQDTTDGTYIYNNYCSGPWDFDESAWPSSTGYKCYRQATNSECRKGGQPAPECTGVACPYCCSGRTTGLFTRACTTSGLTGDCVSTGCTVITDGPYWHGDSGSTCCVEQNELGYRCVSGTCIKNAEGTLPISRGAWDQTSSGGTSWAANVQKGAVLYFETGDSRHVPNDPSVTPAISLKWSSAHAWKLETYVLPTQAVSGKMVRVYADDGMRLFYYNLQGNAWVPVAQNWSCVTGLFDETVKTDGSMTKTGGCPVYLYLQPNNWYKFEFYLYNDPFGVGESGGVTPWEPYGGDNPFGLRVQDVQTPSASLADILGTGSVISSEPPGDDGAVITGSATVFANEGLKEIRDVTKFATTHALGDCSSGVDCSLRMACGSSDYEGVKTNKYGWILNHAIYPADWSDVGGVSTVKAGYITSNGRSTGEPMLFEQQSISSGWGRSRYTDLWYGFDSTQSIGGIYRCAKDWPSWEADCPNTDPNPRFTNRYAYMKGSDQMKCCYIAPRSIDADQKVTIDYYSGYQYIINFLPGAGDKLCAISTVNVGDSAGTSVIYQSNYTNRLCDTRAGSRCCYCRPDWGCRMDCINELNMSASTKFTLPFPVIGPFWEFKNMALRLEATEPPYTVNLTSQGDEKDGWDISAKLGDRATLILDRNYTIPFNLYSDFGIVTPEERGMYTLVLRVNTTATSVGIIPTSFYSFFATDCTKEGQKGSYYDEEAYPSTKGKGVCKSGTRTCVKIMENDLRWAYSTKYDMPVYPSPETCNGLDDDCNGITDDVMTFDEIIDEIIGAGGGKTPYQVTKCGCFMGAIASDERCNGIDDDCNGVVDDSTAKVWSNTCDTPVDQCIKGGSPYAWCRNLYNSTQCSLRLTEVTATGNVTINTCTQKVRDCMNNQHVTAAGSAASFTYDECKAIYNNYSCFLTGKKMTALGGTCRCTSDEPQSETCNGVDDNCNGAIDDVQNASTCGCSFLTNTSLIASLKSKGDASCDGIDSNCNGAIDDGARACACNGRSPSDTVQIKGKVKEMCDGIDNDCNGLADETFPQIGKQCGYGICTGGIYVCGVHGDQAVCNTTVSPDETFSGIALKLSSAETCDLRDNDCDYSIDEDCSCTPESSVKLCGYQSGIYYRDKAQLTQTCGQVMEELKKLITWAEAPENVKYRRLITVRNNDNVVLANYPVNITFNTFLATSQGRIRKDGGDLRITPSGIDTHVVWGNSSRFNSPQTIIWFKASLAPNEEKKYYMYYGNPTATYAPASISQVTGLEYGRGLFLLCHFDGTTACEGNMVPKYDSGVTFVKDERELFGEMVGAEGVYMDGFDRLSYPTSENFNSNRGTVMMWFKPTDLTEDHYLFYSADLAGNPQFSLRFSENGTYFEAYDKNGNAHRINAGVVNLGWHHIAATWDNLKGASIYIDGILKSSVNAAWEAHDIGIDAYVGSDGTAKTAYALIDELAVYSQELDQAAIREKMRYYQPSVRVGTEETLNETVTVSETDVYGKCATMLQNISADEAKKATILSLCDSVRICNKTDFPVNPISECTFGVQMCTGGDWSTCSAVMPKTEACNGKDDDCNGAIDDVAIPETCACYKNARRPDDLQETCNGVDDDCDEAMDDVKGGSSPQATHCGCYDQIVNITQRVSEKETLCNGIDDNCDGTIDEGIGKCACAGSQFSPYNNTWATAISAERCDDVDNDCNGVIDDPWIQGGIAANRFEYLGAPCSPLNSRCVGGMYVCSKDGNDMVCSTTSDDGLTGNDLRENETCNALDDDCNGRIDDVWGDISGKFCRCFNGVPRTNETCNGVDDDCNGFTDDNLKSCGCSFELETNINNINQLSVLLSGKKTGGETCNNIDDDCNGAIDDGLEGECFCSGGFEGNAATKPEFCNGFDDDCNGAIDDVAYHETCACYNGTSQPGMHQEICNGKDDDCNGLVDEDWPTLGSLCGMGVCSGGVYECASGGNGAVCSTGPGGSQTKAGEETCGNNIDDDCDGALDENCVCDTAGTTRKCSLNAGVCQEGVQTCTDSGWSSCIGGVMPSAELCNGADDDCDGTVDNVADPSKCACYNDLREPGDLQESCNGVDDDCDGTMDDVDNRDSAEATQCGCYGNAYGKGAKPEVCNRIDDDCDGTVDNVKGGESVEAARCSCYKNALPAVESCNGIDDDCDEAMDEDWTMVRQACGEGICSGTFICSADGKNVVCDGRQPELEICDGKDNNCDGTVDEGCYAGEVGSCENGVQDGDETGVDCGGICPNACTPASAIPPGAGSWMLVFGILVVVIVAVGIALVFLKPAAEAPI